MPPAFPSTGVPPPAASGTEAKHAAQSLLRRQQQQVTVSELGTPARTGEPPARPASQQLRPRTAQRDPHQHTLSAMQPPAFAEQQIKDCFIVKGHSSVISQGSGTRTAAPVFVPEVGETPDLEQRSHSAQRDSTSRHISSLPPPGFSSRGFSRTHEQQRRVLCKQSTNHAASRG